MAVFVNGKFCKDPMQVKAEDFSFKGLNVPRDTSNRVGSNVTLLNVDQIPGLNTLGISLARLDYAPYGGLNPPHTHPRGTEILRVTNGGQAGGRLRRDDRSYLLGVGRKERPDLEFGLIHFQLNVAKTPAVAFAGLSSQNPGVITIANAVFGANPPVNPDVLTKAFQLDKEIVADLQKKFAKN
ncbi:Germin-like protein subfamily 1 member 13 [Linum perenne]